MLKAQKTYKTWHEKDPKELIELDVPGLSLKGPWVVLGTLPEIMYDSKKWESKTHRYLHKFGKKPYLCTDPEGKVLLIVGGNFKITNRGIVG